MKIVLASQILASLNALNEVRRLQGARNSQVVNVPKKQDDNGPKHASDPSSYVDNRDCHEELANTEDNLWKIAIEQVCTQSHDQTRDAAWDTTFSICDPHIMDRVTADEDVHLDNGLPRLIVKYKVPVKLDKEKVCKQRKRYKEDVKNAVLRMFFHENRRRSEISSITNIHYSNVRRWISEAMKANTY